MRRAGLAILFVAFGWLLAYQAGVLLRGARPALRDTLTKLDQQPNKSYSGQEVAQLIGEAGRAQYEATPIFVLPGILMLVGGLLVFVGPRRSRGKSAA